VEAAKHLASTVLASLDNDHGFVMSPDGSWAFASRAAAPTDTDKKDLLENGRKLVLNTARAVFNNCGNVRKVFQEANEAGKDVVDFVTPKGQPSTGGIRIEMISKVLDTLGGGDIRILQEDASGGVFGPAYFANIHGDIARA